MHNFQYVVTNRYRFTFIWFIWVILNKRYHTANLSVTFICILFYNPYILKRFLIFVVKINFLVRILNTQF